MKYFHKHYHVPGTAPGTLAEHRTVSRAAPHIDITVYNADQLQEHCTMELLAERSRLQQSHIIWAHIHGSPHTATLQKMAELFALHPLALEDVANNGQRPKVEHYPKQLFMTLSLPCLQGIHMGSEQISIFLGDHYLVSFHNSEIDLFNPVRKRLRLANGRLRTHHIDYLLYALIDRVIDEGFPILERFGEELAALETALLDRPSRKTLLRIHEIRRDLVLLRRLVWPQRELINTLLHDEQSVISDETRLYLRDCYDHTIQILDLVETYRDMAAGLSEMYLSSINHRLNEVMKFLTLISTIFMPLTFIVGIYGMNFGRGELRSPWAMPELDWYYGYPLVWTLIIVIALAMITYFRYKRWL